MTPASQPDSPRPSVRTLVVVAAWGATTTVVAFVVSGGSIPVFVAALVTLGVIQRVVAVRVARRRGDYPPPWWQV